MRIDTLFVVLEKYHISQLQLGLRMQS